MCVARLDRTWLTSANTLYQVAISATTLALLVVLIDYYRVLNTLWNLRWHVTKPVPLVLNVRLLIPLVPLSQCPPCLV